MRAIGLMSGTSLDGIDAALVDVRPRGAGYVLALERFACTPFDAALRDRIVRALPPQTPSPARVAELDVALGEAFAAAALAIANGAAIDFIAHHGLTLYHRGEAGETLQIGSPYHLRDALDASVVFDFRRADCAAGGQGAPLVPFVDALLFASAKRDVVALNLGGIANVTVLPRGATPLEAIAWDTGPGNMLIDAFVTARTHGAERYDRDGAYAARGTADAAVVEDLIAREAFYFALPPPKSTGRERFGAQLLEAHAALFAALSIEDGCATLAALTAETIARSLALYGLPGAHVLASGGGTHNATLMRLVRDALQQGGMTLATSDTAGVDPDAKEAIAFAVLAYETLRGRPSSVPGATGAARPAVLGAIAPAKLAALLAKMRAEVTANGRT